ncbi:alkaline phosphatase [Pseudonocardia sp. DSM 110487]|uniref:alkaline phosphatase n=1 Tax=Pseudonocardia sp. DSM 110487 TaxID=2865833 RepID=UPI001C6A576F|nr:alkaline phosphatase [Pseudonocardia sp. DSM 110487]QYN38447.1 alkaline phosphatase [Pseudonocardia sp. DSM 110487]
MAAPVRSRVARALAAGALACALAACSVVPADAPEEAAREEVARNVILILASGMGRAQHDFLQLAIAGPTGLLAMDRLGSTGSVTPVDPVSDDAAGATTLSTGMPTRPGAIGVDADGESLTTVLEHARNAGKAIGIVTTGEVTDPTPAAFAAHVAPRPPLPDPDEQDEEDGAVARAIARQYLEETRVDVILGGGAGLWTDLAGKARSLGYTTVSDAVGLRATSAERLLGLFADGPMFDPGRPGDGLYLPAVPLPDMTRAALAALDRREAGFFLVVDEAGMDAMAREGNGALVLEAGRALDATVQAARDFQAVNPGTLIVVAGDHETGGLSFTTTDPGTTRSGSDGPYPAADSDQQLWLRWTRNRPTNSPVPIAAGGPGAEAFHGGMANTQIFPELLEAMSLRA